MNLRRFNQEGMSSVDDFLDSLSTASPLPYPESILEDDKKTILIHPNVNIERYAFENKFLLAEYLSKKIESAGISSVEKDRGFWVWLALFYFPILCIKDSSGKYKPGARPRWVPEVHDYRRYYRHLLAGPYLIFRAHRDNPARAMALLCGKIDRQGDIVEQLASRIDMVANPAIVGAATKLYYDPKKGKAKAGAGSKGAGSPRRLSQVIKQFDLTWDLYGMSPEYFLKLLPQEFDRFQKK